MSRRIVFSTLILIAIVIAQTTLFRNLPFKGVTPDIAMLALLFISHRNGNIPGQVCGFATGLFEDLMSISPLGFHTLMKTVIGFLAGSTAGRMFSDPFLTPVIFASIATVLKGLLAGLLSFVFSIQLGTGSMFSLTFLIELGLNVVLAPPVFFLIGLLKFLFPIRREGIL